MPEQKLLFHQAKISGKSASLKELFMEAHTHDLIHFIIIIILSVNIQFFYLFSLFAAGSTFCLTRNLFGWFLLGWGETLPQAEELKYGGVLFKGCSRME